MIVKFTNESIDWFHEKKIFSHSRSNINTIFVGAEVEFLSDLTIEPYTGFYPHVKKIIKAGAFSYTHSVITHPLHFQMGRYCSIASDVTHRGYNHQTSFLSTSPFGYDPGESIISSFITDDCPDFELNLNHSPQGVPAKVENDVWIGAGCVLYPNIIIATGSIIATHSVLTKSTGPYEIWGGNPAKLIKKRFDDETIRLLLETQWWEYKFTDFKGLSVSNPFEFAKKFLIEKDGYGKYLPELIKLSEMPGDILSK